MFLYLSKLLPPLIYPLGLACVLMFVALVTLWKRPRVASVAIMLALIFLFVGGNSWTSRYLVRSLEWQNLPASDLPNAEAIVILGGATRSTAFPRPSVEVNEAGDRLLYAASLYQQHKAPLIILSGGRIEWLGTTGSAESMAMATLLQQIGVTPSAIIEEQLSRNTYENAVNVKKILSERGIHRVLLVTSAMHMPRSLLIFKRQGIAAIAAPTDFLVSDYELQELSNPQSWLLYLLPNATNLEQFSSALKEYFGLVVYRLRGWL